VPLDSFLRKSRDAPFAPVPTPRATNNEKHQLLQTASLLFATERLAGELGVGRSPEWTTMTRRVTSRSRTRRTPSDPRPSEMVQEFDEHMMRCAQLVMGFGVG